MKLTRAQQDAIIDPIVMAYRRVSRERRDYSYHPDLVYNVSQFRAALRLDDPVLDELIARGAHKRPWSSEVGTMEKVIAKYGG